MRNFMKFSIPSVLALGLLLGATVSSCYSSPGGGDGGDSDGGGGSGDASCTNSADCSGGLICSNSRCVSCTVDSQCAAELVCIAGTCKSKAAFGEACDISTDCQDATLECAEAPRSVCVKKGGETCQVDNDCLYGCLNSKCVTQQPTIGSSCSADSQCPTGFACSPSIDPKLNGQLVCLKKDGQQCFVAKECVSANCNGECQPCLEGIECNSGKADCRTYRTTCSNGRSLCVTPGAAKPDFSSCTEPKNTLVDTCFSGECKMKLYKRQIGASLTNFRLGTQARTDPKVKQSIDSSVPIYAEISIAAGVRVSSESSGDPAMYFAELPSNSIVKVVNRGQILGTGGNGGQGAGVNETNDVTQIATDGTAGGNAIYTELKLFIDNIGGDLRGGGGGGGGGGGMYQWTDCIGIHDAQGMGGGGGGGAGLIPGRGGKGADTPSTYFGASLPGGDGSEAFPGAGGYSFDSTYPEVTCRLKSNGGFGGNGGKWGQNGANGGPAHDSGTDWSKGQTYAPAGKGGLAGYAVYRARGAELHFVPGKDANGNMVIGFGNVMGKTELPTP